MEENLKKVWSERDASRRLNAIENIYDKDVTLFHVNHKTVGHQAVNNSVSTLLSNTPKDFIFFKMQPVIINNNIGRLIWGIGINEDTPIATGMDIAIFENGKIKSLYVFLD
ncbi:hypothetical protein D3C80_1052550 [compost metagenome]